jgi:hypothetical protein
VVGVPAPPEGVVAEPAEVVTGAAGVVAEPPEVVVAAAGVVAEPDEVVVELELELELELATAAALAVEVGTVNAGAPEMSGVEEPPPPHAVRPTLSVRAARTAGRRIRRRTQG